MRVLLRIKNDSYSLIYYIWLIIFLSTCIYCWLLIEILMKWDSFFAINFRTLNIFFLSPYGMFKKEYAHICMLCRKNYSVFTRVIFSPPTFEKWKILLKRNIFLIFAWRIGENLNLQMGYHINLTAGALAITILQYSVWFLGTNSLYFPCDFFFSVAT